MSNKNKNLVALFTNNDDDIYCFRKELIEGIINADYDMLISCPYGEKLTLMGDIEYIYDDPVIDRRGTNLIADFKLFLHYFKLLKKHRPTVVLTYTAKPNVYGALAAHALRIPVISNVTGFGSVLKKNKLIQSFIMTLFKVSFRRARCIMFQNETNMKTALTGGMVKGDYQLIPGSGVDTDRYPLQPYPSGGDGMSGDKVVFNYIGRILEDKGVEDYIAAAKVITAKYPCTEFNMLGFVEETESHYNEDLCNLENKGVIKYHGSQKDTKPFVKNSHAIIHPSTYGEGMSNVLLESASSGRPIISTDNPGCRETFIDGQTGFLYHGGDVNALCEKIEVFLKLSNERREAMGKAGREYIKENFSRDIVVDTYLKKINEIKRS